MFQHLRNYAANLASSQKFYYDNYDYYNVYENEQKQYKDDLSKFVFHCNRKSTVAIVTYNSNPKNMRTVHSRVIKVPEKFKNFCSTHDNNNNDTFYKNDSYRMSMEQFLSSFLDVWIENNYKETQPSEKQIQVDDYQIISLSLINDLKYQFEQETNNNNSPSGMTFLSTQELLGVISRLTEVNQQKISWLEEEYAKQNNIGIFNLQCQVAFEMFCSHTLKKYTNPQNHNFRLLYEFIVEVNRIMWEILNGRFRSILFLAQPNCQYIHYLIHPLVIPLMVFMKYNHNQFNKPNQRLFTGLSFEKPKIVLLNLDGRQTMHNLRNIKGLGQDMLYISLFNQPKWSDRKFEQMEHMFSSEEEIESTYGNLCQLFSQFIIKEYLSSDISFTKTNKGPQIMLFPLKSSFLLKKSEECRKSSSQNTPHSFPCLDTPLDILFLFETIIYEKLRQFGPTMIFISYNGSLEQLNKCGYKGSPLGPNGTEVFGDIVRNCSILADHRVIMFPNFVHLFDSSNEEETDEKDDEIEDDDGKIKCAREYYHKYFQYQLDQVNTLNPNINIVSVGDTYKVINQVKQQPLFQSISLFLKYGPGLYSTQDGQAWQQTPSWKFGMANRYEYLHLLQDVAQLPFMQNHSLQKLSSFEIYELYKSYAQQEIKENSRENQYYEKLISTIISEFSCETISDQELRGILSKQLYYKLQDVIQELSAKTLIQQGGNSNDIQLDTQGLLSNYFSKRKITMLLENMENYKINKHYYIADSQNQQGFDNVQCFKFVLKKSSNIEQEEETNYQGQELLLQKYTQIIIQEPSSVRSYGHSSNILGKSSSIKSSNSLVNNSTVYLVNYKSPENGRHMILVGQINSIQAEKTIQMVQVMETDRQLSEEVQEYFQYHYLNQEGHFAQKQDIIYVNYNYCRCPNDILYLYWPLQYNLKEQARCRLLGLEYQSKRVFKMIKVVPYQNNQMTQTGNLLQYKYEKVLYDPQNGISIGILPRWGCTSFPVDQKSFLIFGGIFQSELDYLTLSSNISLVKVIQNPNKNLSNFVVQSRTKVINDRVQCFLPSKIGFKVRQEQSGNSSQIIPKINMKMEQQETQQKLLRVYSGYGRYNTNCYNLFAYQQYFVDLQKLIPQRVIEQNNSRVSRKLVLSSACCSTGSPDHGNSISINKIGKFSLLNSIKNMSETQEKFSDTIKNKFIFQKKIENGIVIGNNKINNSLGGNQKKNANNNIMNLISNDYSQLVSFVDDSYRISEFKSDNKKRYLFGFMQIIRQKIYTKHWSPQLYIVSQANFRSENLYPLNNGSQKNTNSILKPHIVNLLLNTDKNNSYIIASYLMPREEDIMSLCLEEDKIYLISSSPIINSLESTSSHMNQGYGNNSKSGGLGGKYVLYEGSLSNMPEIIRKREVQMNSKYSFNSKKSDKFLNEKSIFINEQLIYVVGGLSILQSNNLPFKTSKNEETEKVYQREDYILQQIRKKYTLKIQKLTLAQENLDMPNSFVVKLRSKYYLYSILLDENCTGVLSANTEINEQDNGYQIWKLKIQEHSYESNAEMEFSLKVGEFKVYFYNVIGKEVQMYPRYYLEEPKFVSITPYKRFDIGQVRQIIFKILWSFKKNTEYSRGVEVRKLITIIQSLINTDDFTEKQLEGQLFTKANVFEELILLLSESNNNTTGMQEEEQIENTHRQQRQEYRFEYEYEELIKHLRHCYYLVHKMILQKNLYLQDIVSEGKEDQKEEFRFIIEDKTSRKVKYIAIGRLGTTRLNFFRIRFNHELNICLNHNDDNGFYYHPAILGCMKFDYESIKNKSNTRQYSQNEQISKIKVYSVKNQTNTL